MPAGSDKQRGQQCIGMMLHGLDWAFSPEFRSGFGSPGWLAV